MQRAFSYIRFSREHQSRGNSLDRQKQATLNYCTKHELLLDDSLELRDLGVSSYTGRNLSHGALGRFIVACEKGLIPPGSALIVEALDRLSRQSPRKTLNLLNRLLDEFRIELHLTSSGKVFKPDAGADEGIDLILAVAMAIEANRASEEKATRLQAAWANIRKQAEDKKRIMRKIDVPWWLLVQDDKITAPQERVDIVQQVFKLTASGLSSLQIARQLNTDKVDTFRKQKVWTSGRIRGLVMDIRIEGTIRATPKTRKAGRDYAIKNYYPRVIEPELVAAARAILKRNTRGTRGREGDGKRPINLFRGLLRHKRLWLRHSTHPNGLPDPETGEKKYNGYYECINELAPKNRCLYCISAKQLEPIIVFALAELTPADLVPAKKNVARELLAHLRGEVAALHTKRTNVLAAIEEGANGLAIRLNELDKLIAAKTAEVAKAEVFSARPINETTKDLKPLVEKLSDTEARRLIGASLRRLVKQIDIGDDLADLFLPSQVRQDFIRERMKHRTGPLKDPTPNRARRPLWCLISFVSGAHRLIVRPAKDGGIFSMRVEPPPASKAD